VPAPQLVSKEAEFLCSINSGKRFREDNGIADQPVVLEQDLVGYDPFNWFVRDALQKCTGSFMFLACRIGGVVEDVRIQTVQDAVPVRSEWESSRKRSE